MILYEFIAWSIDFEGSISISKNENIYYQVQLSIINSSKELLEDFQYRVKFGKILEPYSRKNKKQKDIYFWVMNQKEIRQYLPLIQPYLHLKWRQGELVIEVLNIQKNGQKLYTWEEICILESCYKECKELNRKGIQK